MDKGAWQATVHGVTKSWTQLRQLGMHACTAVKAQSPTCLTDREVLSLVCSNNHMEIR